MDLFNIPDSDFEKILNSIADLSNQAYDLIKKVMQEYQDKYSISLDAVIDGE